MLACSSPTGISLMGLCFFFEFGTFPFICAPVWLVRKCWEKNNELRIFVHWVLPYLEPGIKTLIRLSLVELFGLA